MSRGKMRYQSKEIDPKVDGKIEKFLKIFGSLVLNKKNLRFLVQIVI